MKVVALLTLGFLMSCASAERHSAELQEKIAAHWKDRPVTALKQELAFEYLRRVDEASRITFIKDDKLNTGARCVGLGGCFGMPFEVGCEHVFFHQENKITNYSSRGDCASEMEWLVKKYYSGQ